jgi:hypothetical protein
VLRAKNRNSFDADNAPNFPFCKRHYDEQRKVLQARLSCGSKSGYSQGATQPDKSSAHQQMAGFVLSWTCDARFSFFPVLFRGGSGLRKRIRLSFLLLLVTVASVSSYSQVSGNVYDRTVLLKTTVGTGTAFAIDIDNRQYLVTARHMVTGLGDHHQVSVLRENQWKSLEVTIFRCKDPIDIAVLVPNQLLTHADALPVSYPSKLYFGQELFFVGFPFGWSMQFPESSRVSENSFFTG